MNIANKLIRAYYKHKAEHGFPPESFVITQEECDELYELMTKGSYPIGQNDPVPDKPLFMGVPIEIKKNRGRAGKMTHDEIMQMEAGREMDALIAEHVLGYRRVVDDTFDYDHIQHNNEILIPPYLTLDDLKGSLPNKGEIAFDYFVHEEYSEDIESAWNAAGMMTGSGYEVYVHIGTRSPFYSCAIVRDNGEPGENHKITIVGEGKSDSAPLAICRAILLATLSQWKLSDRLYISGKAMPNNQETGSVFPMGR